MRSASGSRRSPESEGLRALYLLEEDERLAGFYGLAARGADGEVRFLYVVPGDRADESGVELWRHAVATARRLGFRDLIVDATAATASFFTQVGAEPISSPAGDGAVYRYPLRADIE